MEEYRQDLLQVLKVYGIEALDFREEFGKAENSPLYFDHVHPNDDGHQKLAELLIKYLKQRYKL